MLDPDQIDVTYFPQPTYKKLRTFSSTPLFLYDIGSGLPSLPGMDNLPRAIIQPRKRREKGTGNRT